MTPRRQRRVVPQPPAHADRRTAGAWVSIAEMYLGGRVRRDAQRQARRQVLVRARATTALRLRESRTALGASLTLLAARASR